MADSAVDKKEAVPVVEKEVEKQKIVKEVADEDSKQSENGDVKLKENGEKVAEDEESKDGENGDSDGPEACPVKRKSAGGDAPEGAPTEGASPEKKAKLDDKQTAEAESNGDDSKADA